MCFGSEPPPPQQTPTPTPAAAPPAPSPSAAVAQQDVGSAQRSQDLALFGTSTPSLRVDRSATSGGVGLGGSGLKV